MEDIFRQAKDIGITFIVLAGGEPLISEDVITKATNFPEILFPLFTNGTMLNDNYLKIFNENRNLVPIISIECDEEITDMRRGKGVYSKVIDSMEFMRKNGIIFGVSLTFTKRNISSLISNEFIERSQDLGCKVVFFIEYVPLNAKTKDIPPAEKERNLLSNEIKNLRKDYSDMLFMSFYGDEKTSGGCLAAGRGFFHINSHVDAEACSASPYSDTNVKKSSVLDDWILNYSNTLKMKVFLSMNMKVDVSCLNIKKMLKRY